jgi:hypothetical protein
MEVDKLYKQTNRRIFYSLIIFFVLLMVLFSLNCGNNPITNGGPDRAAQEVLIYEHPGLVDSVVSIPNVSEVTHVTTLGMLDYSGANYLRIKYKYFNAGDSLPYIYANDVCLFSGIYGIYHSGSFNPVAEYTEVNDVIPVMDVTETTKLRLTVFYSCRVLSVRDLQIYKY